MFCSIRYRTVDIYITGIPTVSNLARHKRGILAGWGNRWVHAAVATAKGTTYL
jgi:hypothetical protein